MQKYQRSVPTGETSPIFWIAGVGTKWWPHIIIIPTTAAAAVATSISKYPWRQRRCLLIHFPVVNNFPDLHRQCELRNDEAAKRGTISTGMACCQNDRQKKAQVAASNTPIIALNPPHAINCSPSIRPRERESRTDERLNQGWSNAHAGSRCSLHEDAIVLYWNRASFICCCYLSPFNYSLLVNAFAHFTIYDVLFVISVTWLFEYSSIWIVLAFKSNV